MNETLARVTPALSDRYRIERELGAGGMATVFLARDLRHDRNVAIKVLHPELAAVLGAERFLAEIKTTAKLQHPHILPLLDSGEADGLLFYVMPVVEGESLRARLDRETQLPLDEALRITEEVAGALDYAHRHGVIHRDIKPENILVHDGQAIVADFGIALAVSAAGGARLTQTGLSLGTPQYMSPEQAMGERAIDSRSDVYSLGCVLYEMLAGEAPFTGPTAQAIIAKVITTEATPVSAARPTVPPHVARAIRTALQKLPADRFPSAAAFADALEHASAAVLPEASAVPSSVLGTRATLLGRGRQIAWGAALVAVGVVVGALAHRAIAGRVSEGPTIRLASPVLDGARGLAIARDGRLVVAAGGEPSHLYIRRLGDLAFSVLPSTENATNPFLSPSAEWVGFVQNNRLKKMRPDGGPAIELADADWGWGAWSAEDDIIYTPAYSTGLWRVSARGGKSEMLSAPDTTRGELGHWWPQLLPDGHTVLFTVFATPFKNSRIEAIDLRTKKRKVLLEGAVYGVYVRSGFLLFNRGTKTVLAVAFDPGNLQVHGDPVPVLDDVQHNYSQGQSLFAVSENGTLAYLPHSDWTPKSQLVWVDRTGKTVPVLPEPDYFAEPRLSPDQQIVAITKEEDTRDVWLENLARSFATPLTRHEASDFNAVWTPDGRRVIYMSERPVFDIYWRAADLSSGEEPLLRSKFDKYPSSVSPDGKFLAYSTDVGNEDIKFLALDGSSTPPEFVNTKRHEMQPAFSPNGRWIAYTSDESGRFQVYIRPFANPASQRQQVSIDGGREPRWTRGGTEIVFRHGDQMMAAPIDPATGVPGRAVELFRGQWLPEQTMVGYDVTPDGNRFLMVKPQNTSPTHDVVIVINWFAELKRKLAK